jgi:hypothetical protein
MVLLLKTGFDGGILWKTSWQVLAFYGLIVALFGG